MGLSACSSPGLSRWPTATASPDPTPTHVAIPTLAPGVVAVSLSEMSILVSTNVAPAGEVTFQVKNAGELPHELVVVRTDLDAEELPVEDVLVVERGLNVVARTAHVNAGEQVSLTVELTPGHYVLICNLSGHYEASQFGPGMRENFDVAPA